MSFIRPSVEWTPLCITVVYLQNNRQFSCLTCCKEKWVFLNLPLTGSDVDINNDLSKTVQMVYTVPFKYNGNPPNYKCM